MFLIWNIYNSSLSVRTNLLLIKQPGNAKLQVCKGDLIALGTDPDLAHHTISCHAPFFSFFPSEVGRALSSKVTSKEVPENVSFQDQH